MFRNSKEEWRCGIVERRDERTNVEAYLIGKAYNYTRRMGDDTGNCGSNYWNRLLGCSIHPKPCKYKENGDIRLATIGFYSNATAPHGPGCCPTDVQLASHFS